MSKKFVRNITDIEEIEKQEKDTNIQNDILSTNSKDVYIRTGDIYHEITNKVKDLNLSNNKDDTYSIASISKSKDSKKNIFINIDFNPLLKELERIDKELTEIKNNISWLDERLSRNIKELEIRVTELERG